VANKTTKFAVGDKVGWDRHRKSDWCFNIGTAKIVSPIKKIEYMNGDDYVVVIDLLNNDGTIVEELINTFWLRKV
jgi:hypothetical protein